MTEQLVSGYVLALDFGGTKLAAAVVELQTGKLLSLVRRDTPADLGAQGTLEAMIDAGKEAFDSSGIPLRVGRIGISFGGPVSKDRTTVLHSHHVEAWDGVVLTEEISSVFSLPTFMDNDANAAALGEWYYGAGQRAGQMIYIQISTGVGAGLILNGRLYRGGAIAGEFGHIIIHPDGETCVCGRKGCIESLIAGWAVARAGRAALPNAGDSSSLRQLCHGKPENVDARLVFEACRRGDPLASEILERGINGLGIGIANVISLFDPEVIVLGGGVTRSRDILDRYLTPALEKYVHPLSKDRYQVRYSTLDGMETLLGAALLTDR